MVCQNALSKKWNRMARRRKALHLATNRPLPRRIDPSDPAGDYLNAAGLDKGGLDAGGVFVRARVKRVQVSLPVTRPL
jgi:hypothetical protein